MRAAVLDLGFSLGRASVGAVAMGDAWNHLRHAAPGEIDPNKLLPANIALPVQAQGLEGAEPSADPPSQKRARTVLDLGTCYRKVINFWLKTSGFWRPRDGLGLWRLG